MGKKKFIDKHNAARLRIVQNGNSSEFQKSDKPINNQTEQSYQLSDIIEQQLNKGKSQQVQQRKTDLLDPLKTDAMALADGREDLWINQLKKKKEEEQSEIKVRLYDEDGNPLEERDSPRGEVVCVFEVPLADRQRVTLDIDFRRDQLTEDQKEVYDALMNEDDEDYEELEDDFITQALGGEVFKLEEIKVESQHQVKGESQFNEIDFPQQQQQQKQVRFQDQQKQQDSEDEFEDYEEEEEIPFEKPKVKQSQDKQKQVKQNHSSDEDDEEDDPELEIDSDMEAEFEREMNNYDYEPEDEKRQKMGVTQLNQVLDDHLLLMKKKEGHIKSVIPKTNLEEEEQLQHKLSILRSTNYIEYLKMKYPNVDPSEFHLPKEVPKIEFEDDQVLQHYINRESTDEECPDLLEADNDKETIVRRQLHDTVTSKMNPEQLNIVKYKEQKKQKPSLNRDQKKQLMKELKQQKEQEKEAHVEVLQKLVRSRDETEEEKKQRKQMIKDLKKQQKEKKKAFKEKVKEVSSSIVHQKNANIQNNQSDGITVLKMS